MLFPPFFAQNKHDFTIQKFREFMLCLLVTFCSNLSENLTGAIFFFFFLLIKKNIALVNFLTEAIF